VLLNSTGIGASGVAIGDIIENVTDGSYSVITAVAADSVATTRLKGGSDNTWHNADKWSVNRFIITLIHYDTDGATVLKREKVLIDSRSGDSLTVNTLGRGFDGSTAQSFSADDYVFLFLTAAAMDGTSQGIGQIIKDIDNHETLIAGKVSDSLVVHNTGNEAIAGIKTFSSIPLLPNSDPVNANDAVRKSYVDSKSPKFGGTGVDGALDLHDLTATGTITSTGASVLGTGTLFTTELAVGDRIIVGAVVKTVATITDNTHLTVSVAYSPDVVTQSFTRGKVTTIDLGGANIFIKNYSSISIIGNTSLMFSNPSANGTTVIFKSTGNVTVTSTIVPAIDLRLMGSALVTNAYGLNGIAVAGANSSNAAGGNGAFWNVGINGKMIKVGPGAGGGSASGAGGRGAGGLYIECAGYLNFTSTINAAGTAAVNTTNAASGGGGGGGAVVILYNSLTANTGTILADGGKGGDVSKMNPIGGGGGGTAGTIATFGLSVGGPGGYESHSATGGQGGAGAGGGNNGGGGTGGYDQTGDRYSSGGGGGGGCYLVAKNTEY
jgi:hypothetical protein